MRAVIASGNERRALEFEAPELLKQLILRAGFSLGMPCGGRGVCGKCRVAASGALSEPDAAERKALSAEELAHSVRLACAAQALGDVEITLPQTIGERIQTRGRMRAFTPESGAEGLGISVDIGTTTVAAYLWQLADGAPLGICSAANPQGAYGADVISRLGKSLEGEAEALKGAICRCLSALTEQLLKESGRARAELRRMLIVGNTAMLYLLTGRNPRSIAELPFIPDTLFGEGMDAAQLGLDAGTEVFLMRCCSAYVGADITAAMLACEMDARLAETDSQPLLLADIGTNGEMALCAGGRLLCCSTAAGPAFEGAGLHQGMNAAEGAIVHSDADFHLEWIGESPKGICGSGIVDILAAMLECGVLDESGQLQEEDHPYEACMLELDDQPAFRIPGTEVVITQKDVRTIQLAKAAICAGMRTLIHHAGLAAEQVGQLMIAGGFGSCIRPETAARIGLIPEELAARAVAVGNAAGSGASLALLSRDLDARADGLSRSAETVDLSTDPYFMEQYVACMFFGDDF